MAQIVVYRELKDGTMIKDTVGTTMDVYKSLREWKEKEATKNET